MPMLNRVARMLKPFIAQIPNTHWLWVNREYGKQLERLIPPGKRRTR